MSISEVIVMDCKCQKICLTYFSGKLFKRYQNLVLGFCCFFLFSWSNSRNDDDDDADDDELFFCGMVDRQKVFSFISSWDHCQRSSLSRISNTPQAGFEPTQNLSSGFACLQISSNITWCNSKMFWSWTRD